MHILQIRTAFERGVERSPSREEVIEQLNRSLQLTSGNTSLAPETVITFTLFIASELDVVQSRVNRVAKMGKGLIVVLAMRATDYRSEPLTFLEQLKALMLDGCDRVSSYMRSKKLLGDASGLTSRVIVALNTLSVPGLERDFAHRSKQMPLPELPNLATEMFCVSTAGIIGPEWRSCRNYELYHDFFNQFDRLNPIDEFRVHHKISFFIVAGTCGPDPTVTGVKRRRYYHERKILSIAINLSPEDCVLPASEFVELFTELMLQATSSLAEFIRKKNVPVDPVTLSQTVVTAVHLFKDQHYETSGVWFNQK